MKTEMILADAEVAACYLRALVDKGVPMMAADCVPYHLMLLWHFQFLIPRDEVEQ